MIEKSPLRDERGELSLFKTIETATCPPSDPALSGTHKSAGLSPSSSSAVVVDPVTGGTFVLGTCQRKTWYKIMGYPEEVSVPDARMERIMAMGDVISQKFVYEPAKRAGIWAGDEISFYDPDNLLSGRLDMMAYLPGTIEKCGVEVKSMSAYMDIPWIKSGQRGFKYLEPRYYDLPQVMSYMQWWLQYGVRYWSIYYMTRDMTSNMFCFEWANVPKEAKRPGDDAFLKVHSSERTWDLPWLTWGQIRKRYDSLKVNIKNKTIPPRDFELEYSNATLLSMASNAGKGSQFVDMNNTDSEKVQTRFRAESKKTKSNNPEDHAPYLSKGSYGCAYCPYKKMCWTGLGGPSAPAVDVSEWSKAQPKAPVIENVTKFIRPRIEF